MERRGESHSICYVQSFTQHTDWQRVGQETVQRKVIFHVETELTRKESECRRQGRADKDLCMGDVSIQLQQACNERTVRCIECRQHAEHC